MSILPGHKPEIRNPKSETIPKHEIQNKVHQGKAIEVIGEAIVAAVGVCDIGV